MMQGRNADVATIIGPLVAVEGAPDDVPPRMILGTSAMDVPDDEGGPLAVSWEPSIAEDCAFSCVHSAIRHLKHRTEDGAGVVPNRVPSKDSVWHPSSRIALRMVRRLMRLMDSLSSTGGVRRRRRRK